MAGTATFEGFPVAALDFYDDLEVKAPMAALVAALEPEFGPAKVFRPYRDVRFAKDKTPYKTHQGAFVASGPSTGWYVQVGAAGVRVGVGFYDADSARLAALRDAVADDRSGPQLRRILNRLVKQGWELGGETLKTTPRGYDADHPRIELLRHRSLTAGHPLGFDPVIHTPALLDLVRTDWQRLRPLVQWVAEHVRA
jgi:uncharacterized protein (TIGR02453 family)